MPKPKVEIRTQAIFILRGMRKIGFILLLIISGLPLWRCANQTTPMGGPKDTIPPILIKSIPEHKQKNYKNKSIELEFNENITLFNPKDEILISPSVGKDIEYKYKKNIVIITPTERWQDSATYSIAFREGIKDLTENNPAENLKLAFSTGPSIDSLYIHGSIKFALKETIPEKITVAIYQADTFDIFQHTPTYFTLNNKKGKFSLDNIKAGTYKIYAFDDKNKNLKVESSTEKFGFLSEPITLEPKMDSITISLINLDTREPVLNNVRNTGLFTRFTFNKALDQYRIQAATHEPLVHAYGTDQSQIILYNPKEIIDSLQINLTAIDSVEQRIDTTLFIKQVDPNFIKEDFITSPGKVKYHYRTNLLEQTFRLSKPLMLFTYDSMFIKVDSAFFIPILPDDFEYDTITKKLILKKIIPTDTLFKSLKINPELIMGKGSLISIESDSSKSYSAAISKLETSNTGTLLVETKTTEPNYIIQLTTLSNEIVEEIKNVNTYSFNYLSPGNYKIKIIIDKNNNGRWDAGNIFKNMEPEPIVYYITQDKKYDIPIRANWELGPLLLIF